MIPIIFFGVALFGVLIFCRSVIILPFSSSAADLIPVPPTSTASVVIDFGTAIDFGADGVAGAGGFTAAAEFAADFPAGIFASCSSFICSLLIDPLQQCALAVRAFI